MKMKPVKTSYKYKEGKTYRSSESVYVERTDLDSYNKPFIYFEVKSKDIDSGREYHKDLLISADKKVLNAIIKELQKIKKTL